MVVDAAGNAIISGTKVNAFRPRLNEIDPTGHIVFGADEELVAPFLFGFGDSVAVDTSGHVYWMLSGGGNLSGGGVGYLVKLAPG